VSFACVVDWEAVGAEGGEEGLDAWDYEAGGGYVVLLVFHITSWRADFRWVNLELSLELGMPCNGTWWLGYCPGSRDVEDESGMRDCHSKEKHSQSFCISMITSAVVFGSKELSCGHLYGLASILESMLDNESVEIVGVFRIFRSGTRCTRTDFFFSRGLEENNPKQLRRL